jgi:hypothetical protein
MKGLTAYIYRSSGSSSANGGISERCTEVTLVGPGVPEIFEANESRPAVKLVRRTIGMKEYVHAEPVEEVPSGLVGYMFG